jgi:glycosyltransferase involved in cell wall biosynthesis
MRSVTFAVPGGLGIATGGSVYDRKVIEGLRAAGWRVDVLDWPGSFPFPDRAERREVADSLSDLPAGALTVIDGLALGTLPDLAREQAARLRLVAIVHHPLALETGLDAETAARLAAEEREALRWARKVIVTSDTTAARLVHHYAVPVATITVARPGIELPTQIAGRPSEALRILSVGAVSPRKGHEVLIAALADMAQLPFTCRIVGSLDRDPEGAAALARQIERAGLSARVELTGQVSDDRLTEYHADADVFALASRYEGYGMALAEAMAWGLPVVATTGGAIPEVVPPEAGLLVPPGKVKAFAEALNTMLTDADLRNRLGNGARRAAARIGGWDRCVTQFEQALISVD